MSLRTEVSVGEFIDKLSILYIKAERIKDRGQLENINKEIRSLLAAWNNSSYMDRQIAEEILRLKEINAKLWDIEDRIRLKEADMQFDGEFIELARSIYLFNDERARIKRLVNKKFKSDLYEEKSYMDYKK